MPCEDLARLLIALFRECGSWYGMQSGDQCGGQRPSEEKKTDPLNQRMSSKRDERCTIGGSKRSTSQRRIPPTPRPPSTCSPVPSTLPGLTPQVDVARLALRTQQMHPNRDQSSGHLEPGHEAVL
ncbi:hypothetical protein E5288_WYG001183 [Bos mutus]|uniref:Uncharacterized protein n=1 Tax=Bos mutus TaxID=72004 RepID=A0A6B0RX45_9CETA|nr:hypothetical protein [Bos mutus]